MLGEEADPAELPAFVQQHQYIDLRKAHCAPEQIRRLIEILQSVAPSSAALPAEYWTQELPLFAVYKLLV